MPVPKGVDKGKYDRCVQKVKARGSGYNAYAVCGASLQGMTVRRRSKRR